MRARSTMVNMAYGNQSRTDEAAAATAVVGDGGGSKVVEVVTSQLLPPTQPRRVDVRFWSPGVAAWWWWWWGGGVVESVFPPPPPPPLLLWLEFPSVGEKVEFIDSREGHSVAAAAT